MVVSAGQHMGYEVRHNDALVMFFLKHRRADRYGTDVKPGHPLYERIREQVLAEQAETAWADEDLMLADMDAKIAEMRERAIELECLTKAVAMAEEYTAQERLPSPRTGHPTSQ